MFGPSRYPVHLLVRCPVCAAMKEVDRAEWEKRRTTCDVDLMEMTVIACASGVITAEVWELATNPSKLLAVVGDVIRDREPSLN